MKNGEIENIYLALREDIVTLKYKHGMSLLEQATAQRFGVSRTPIREVFRLLEAHGFVETIQNRGTFVKSVTVNDVKELYEMRCALESTCAGIAAKIISDDEIDMLDSYVKLSEEAFSQGDVESANQYGYRIHWLIIDLCNNNRIKQEIMNIKEHGRRLSNMAGRVPKRLSRSLKEHRLILEALRCREEYIAELCMKRHLLSTMEDMIQVLSDDGNEMKNY